ncbi:hypothetical protein [Myroides odoratus]|uniref:hypothetical protein n=1 Tax=Myroides odoratus TaxID=256 RepID=UPI0033429BC9
MNEKKIKEKIKIPIFSSEIKDMNNGLFEPLDYNALITHIKSKIKTFVDNKKTVNQAGNNKVKKLEISNIEYTESAFQGVPILLLKITAYNTNLLDGFVETEEKREFKLTDKVGSEKNYMLIYPNIFGNSSSNFTYQYKFFVYDDPTKVSQEIISICKLVTRKILDIPVRNIKLENILKELKLKRVLDDVEIHLSSQTDGIDETELNLHKYLISSKVSKTVKNNYKDIPIDEFENLIKTPQGSFIKRVFKIKENKKEYKITEELNILSKTIEEIFNSQYELTQADLEKLFDEEFILKNLEYALTDFYKQNE